MGHPAPASLPRCCALTSPALPPSTPRAAIRVSAWLGTRRALLLGLVVLLGYYGLAVSAVKVRCMLSTVLNKIIMNDVTFSGVGRTRLGAAAWASAPSRVR